MRVHSPNLGKEGNEPSFPSPPKEWGSLGRRLSRSLTVRRTQARPSANSSSVDVSRLVASHVRLREARMAMAGAVAAEA